MVAAEQIARIGMQIGNCVRFGIGKQSLMGGPVGPILVSPVGMVMVAGGGDRRRRRGATCSCPWHLLKRLIGSGAAAAEAGQKVERIVLARLHWRVEQHRGEVSNNLSKQFYPFFNTPIRG